MSCWDRLTVVTCVLNPVLTAMCCCDGMKGGTLTLVYSLLLQLDKLYSEPIEIKPSQTGSCLTCTRLSDWSGNPTDKPTRSGNPTDKPTTRPINRHGNPQRLCTGNPTHKPTFRPINRHGRNRRREIPPINRRTDR